MHYTRINHHTRVASKTEIRAGSLFLTRSTCNFDGTQEDMGNTKIAPAVGMNMPSWENLYLCGNEWEDSFSNGLLYELWTSNHRSGIH